jgi:hypothetical protein
LIKGISRFVEFWIVSEMIRDDPKVAERVEMVIKHGYHAWTIVHKGPQKS